MKVSKIILGLAMILFYYKAEAQDALYFQDINTRPLAPVNYTEVQGSPYFYDDYLSGEVTLADNKVYRDIKLKYDQVAGIVSFKYNNEPPMTFSGKVTDFRLYYSGTSLVGVHFISGVKVNNQATDDAFYQVLAEGRWTLLKKTVKTITENKPYGSATLVRKINSSVNYYVFDGIQATKVRNKKDLLAILNDQSAAITQFIKTNNLNSDESDLAKIVEYYNTLN